MPKEPMLSEYLHSKDRERDIPVSGTFELASMCIFHCISLHELQ